ncbi:spermatogenesis-associated protein 32 [Orcinus orca]|uniref:spermatogenesis-associated protein 32 n=1 Tax=Orcinus orca TaxID=9733 RepID=UPI0021135FBE|nr:spermatogenesis-associated protein 32 [Orcinus orca]
MTFPKSVPWWWERTCLRMDATSAQGALSNLALHPKAVSLCVCTGHTCTTWGKGGRFSRFLEGPGRTEGAAALCQCAQGRCKVQPSRPQAYRSPPSTNLGLLQRAGPPHVSRRGASGWLRGEVGQPTPEDAPQPPSPPTRRDRERCSLPAAVAAGMSQRRRHHRRQRPRHLHRPPQPATKERTGGGGVSSHQPAPRLSDRASVSMGVTGANGFPCCDKESVDIVDTQGGINQNQFQSVQEEDDMELEKELLELESLDKEVPRLDPELEPERKPKPFPQPEMRPVVMLQPEAKLDTEPKMKVVNLEPFSEDPEPQGYKTESLHPYMEGLMQQDISQWSMRSISSYPSTTEEDPLSTDHRSICVQTSKHFFWADKFVQASEHSLQQAISMQPIKESTKETACHPDQPSAPKDTVCSEKQSQAPSAQPALPDEVSQQPPSPQPSASTQTIGLAELIDFASSLAMASSSRMDLPNLGHVIKAPLQMDMTLSTEPTVDHTAQPTVDEPEQENLPQDDALEKPPEEPRETREPHDASKQEDKHFPHSYLDFSKLGFKKATIEGEVKFLQPPNMSPQPQGAGKDSGGGPLLLKIHFKLSSPTSPEKTRQNQ